MYYKLQKKRDTTKAFSIAILATHSAKGQETVLKKKLCPYIYVSVINNTRVSSNRELYIKQFLFMTIMVAIVSKALL